MKNLMLIGSAPGPESPRRKAFLLFLLFLFLAAPAIAQSQSDRSTQADADKDNVPEANPSRPTIASPATLTPVGYLQFENGLLYAEDSSGFSSRLAFEQTTKLTIHPRLQFLVASEPVVHSGLGSVKQFNPGDVLVGVQGVLLAGRENRPTIALSYFKHLYHGSAPDLDIGTPEHSLLLLISDDLAGFHFDVNGFFNDQVENQVGRAQFGQTISISHPLKKFTIGGELWHFTQPFEQGNAVGNLWAISYPVRRNLVVDVGFNRGLTSTSSQWAGFTGFTYLLPHRMWPAEKSGSTTK